MLTDLLTSSLTLILTYNTNNYNFLYVSPYFSFVLKLFSLAIELVITAHASDHENLVGR